MRQASGQGAVENAPAAQPHHPDILPSQKPLISSTMPEDAASPGDQVRDDSLRRMHAPEIVQSAPQVQSARPALPTASATEVVPAIESTSPAQSRSSDLPIASTTEVVPAIESASPAQSTSSDLPIASTTEVVPAIESAPPATPIGLRRAVEPSDNVAPQRNLNGLKRGLIEKPERRQPVHPVPPTAVKPLPRPVERRSLQPSRGTDRVSATNRSSRGTDQAAVTNRLSRSTREQRRTPPRSELARPAAGGLPLGLMPTHGIRPQ
jgi:hypothetical protein